MIKNTSVDMTLAEMIKVRERDRAAQGEVTMYTATQMAAKNFGVDTEQEPPEDAYKAVATFIRKAMTALGKDANDKFAELLTAINQLPPTGISPEMVSALQDKAIETAHCYLFTLAMCKASLADADYRYLAEIAIDAGREAAASS